MRYKLPMSAFDLSVVDITQTDAVQEAYDILHAANITMNAISEIEGLYTQSLKSGFEEDVETTFDAKASIEKIMAAGFDSASAKLLLESEKANHREARLNVYYKQNVKPADINRPEFETIDNDSRSTASTRAWATAYLATDYEHNEKGAIKERFINNSFKINDFEDFGLAYVDGFKSSAAQSYTEAANILSEAGYTQEAAEIEQFASSLEIDFDNDSVDTPQQYVTERLVASRQTVNEINRQLDPGGARLDHPYATHDLKWYAEMTRRAVQSSPSPADTIPQNPKNPTLKLK